MRFLGTFPVFPGSNWCPCTPFQERELRDTRGADRWQEAFFMPTLADRYVRAFRGWLNRFGGGEPGWVPGTDPNLPPLITDKEKLLDRFTQVRR